MALPARVCDPQQHGISLDGKPGSRERILHGIWLMKLRVMRACVLCRLAMGVMERE